MRKFFVLLFLLSAVSEVSFSASRRHFLTRALRSATSNFTAPHAVIRRGYNVSPYQVSSEKQDTLLASQPTQEGDLLNRRLLGCPHGFSDEAFRTLFARELERHGICVAPCIPVEKDVFLYDPSGLGIVLTPTSENLGGADGSVIATEKMLPSLYAAILSLGGDRSYVFTETESLSSFLGLRLQNRKHPYYLNLKRQLHIKSGSLEDQRLKAAVEACAKATDHELEAYLHSVSGVSTDQFLRQSALAERLSRLKRGSFFHEEGSTDA